MKKKAVEIGEIVLIPAGAIYVPAKVLYRSNYYTDHILLGLLKQAVPAQHMPRELSVEIAQQVYTSQEPILKGRWHSVGHQSLLPQQVGLAKRIVGGEVWFEDQCLGPATEVDFKSLPKMQGLGAALVEKRATALLA